MDIDWNKCIICQKDTAESLKCPLRAPGTSVDQAAAAYKLSLANVKQFRDLYALPAQLCFGSDQSADNLVGHGASWHKSCYLKFNKSKLLKAKRKSEQNTDDYERKRLIKRQVLDVQKCFFCEQGPEEGDLHQVSTFDSDTNLRAMITELQDTQLLSRIVGGDLIAMEAKYHLKCLVRLRNRYRSLMRKANHAPLNTNEKINESRAFVELTSYIEKAVKSGTLFFKLSEVHSLFQNRLEDLGIQKTINKTRWKDRLLEHFPEATDQNDGKNTILIFKEGLRNMLKEALKKTDFSEDVLILAKAAKIIRKDIFNHQGFKFSGSFPLECKEDALPSSLKSLVSMILNGANLKDQERHDSQACLTIGQCMLFNMKKRASESTANTRHTLVREPPLPIYIGINIHAITRSKKLIQQMYELGITISYDRVMELEDLLATSVCERFQKDGVVCPASLRKGLFTVGALDNLDHDPSSTSQVSFHGTGMSFFQFPTEAQPGENRQHTLSP